MSRAVPDAWLRHYWLWDLYFGLGTAATIGLVATSGDGRTTRVVAIALLLGMAVAYLVAGRGATRRDCSDRRAGAYLVVVVALFLGAVLLVGQSAWVLFALIPQAFMVLPLRSAIVVALGLNLVPAGRELVSDGVTGELAFLLPQTALLGAFAVIVGRWIDVIITQSRERATLIEELESSREEVTVLSRAAGVAAERERLARDIHDTLAQGFTSIAALLEAVRSELADEPKLARAHVDLALRSARENLAEARTLVSGLTPAPLESGSLSDALARHTERVGAELGIPTTASTEGEPRAVPANVAVVLLRAAQESLANVAKHAVAGSVQVALRYTDTCVAVRVIDDGRGFDPAVAEEGDGFGLRGMAARLGQVGGRLDVRSSPGAGTTIAAQVPA